MRIWNRKKRRNLIIEINSTDFDEMEKIYEKQKFKQNKKWREENPTKKKQNYNYRRTLLGDVMTLFKIIINNLLWRNSTERKEQEHIVHVYLKNEEELIKTITI